MKNQATSCHLLNVPTGELVHCFSLPYYSLANISRGLNVVDVIRIRIIALFHSTHNWCTKCETDMHTFYSMGLISQVLMTPSDDDENRRHPHWKATWKATLMLSVSLASSVCDVIGWGKDNVKFLLSLLILVACSSGASFNMVRYWSYILSFVDIENVLLT